MRNNGRSEKLITKNDKVVTKEKNDNFEHLIFINKIFTKNNFDKFNSITSFTDTTYSYIFIDGITLHDVDDMEISQIYKIIDFIVEYQSFSNGVNVIVHGDISPTNVVFNKVNNLPEYIIDWDGSYFGSKYDDIGYICWLWVNFGNEKKEHDVYIKKISQIFTYLEWNKSDIEKTKKSILERISKEKEKTKHCKNEFLQKWYTYCENWISKYWKF
ncbi:phosphotransferase [Spiroplasma endosymbiont of Othius punctulatus]|uniref:phosphotransferase n=1 Tax=Spiroplasma endosymbiont of Othius punctulatus TaxID=3066289 RepID=UPI0030CCD9F0